MCRTSSGIGIVLSGIVLLVVRGIEKSIGGEPDYAKAHELYEKAAATGDPMANFRLGVMHDNGLGGLKQSYRKARRLYEKAATKGNASGCPSAGCGSLDDAASIFSTATLPCTWHMRSHECTCTRRARLARP